MRDRLMEIAGLEVVAFDLYEVVGHEYIGDIGPWAGGVASSTTSRRHAPRR
jgi:hypothetical protein